MVSCVSNGFHASFEGFLLGNDPSSDQETNSLRLVLAKTLGQGKRKSRCFIGGPHSQVMSNLPKLCEFSFEAKDSSIAELGAKFREFKR